MPINEGKCSNNVRELRRVNAMLRREQWWVVKHKWAQQAINR